MSDRTNRRDLIVEVATTLFMQHGYAGTSVRQIAEAAGMTEAALYYHFKEGKRALFQAVVEHQMPNMIAVIERCEGADSLPELVRCFVGSFLQDAPARMEKMRWLISEYRGLSQEERDLFHSKHLKLQQRLHKLVARFVDDPQQAERYAWTLICATIGYANLFIILEMQQEAAFAGDDLLQVLLDGMAKG